MIFRAVGNLCAVHFDSLKLPVPQLEALRLLKGKGFETIEVNILKLAKRCVGRARYRRGARLIEAPLVFDCSSLIKWLYAQHGIWLPRRSIQQREAGVPVALKEVMAGDLVFIAGALSYFFDDPSDGVGHVGIMTDKETVIHAANSKVGVIESPQAVSRGPISF